MQLDQQEASHVGSQSGRTRGAWWVMATPVLALASLAVVGAIQRQCVARGATARFGHLSRQQAETIAERYFARTLGGVAGTTTIKDAVPQQSIMLRQDDRETKTRAWYVTCQGSDLDTPPYLVRLNAETGQVYGLNVMGRDFSSRSEPAADQSLISWREAELRARQCLRGIGVPFHQLTRVHSRAANHSPDADAWNFIYRRQVPGLGKRTVMVCINRATAQPDDIWNPAAAFTAL